MSKRSVLTFALVLAAGVFAPVFAQEPVAAGGFAPDMVRWSIITAGFALAFAAGLAALAQGRAIAASAEAIARNPGAAGDIRVQAKERVPKAVLNAAEAMKPHFDKCIDDFAKRLSEFVSNAGNTLYKGISEILDRTMSERREAGGQLDGMKLSTTSQIAQVRATTSALRQLREGLWSADTPVDLPDLRPNVS